MVVPALIAKRKIAESIVEKIVIGDGEIDITLSYLPSSEELTKTQQQLIRLLAFEQRIIHASRSHIPTKRSPRKAFPISPQTPGDRIRVNRFEKGLTQRQLASKLEVTPLTLRYWETNRRKPTEAESRALATLLDIAAPVKTANPTVE